MSLFICYGPDGNIAQWGECDEALLALHALPGTVAMFGKGTALTHYVKDGVLTEYTEPQKTLKSQRPAYPTHWSNTSMCWVDLRTLEDCMSVTRVKRDQLLLSCDWTQLPDVPQAIQTAWVAYRQALRDVTTQTDQRNVLWPSVPNYLV